MAFLMIGIHAINSPKDMANRIRVEDNPDNACHGHNEVKGQMSAFLSQKTYVCFLCFMRSNAI